jgi:hypothetical protein
MSCKARERWAPTVARMVLRSMHEMISDPRQQYRVIISVVMLVTTSWICVYPQLAGQVLLGVYSEHCLEEMILVCVCVVDTACRKGFVVHLRWTGLQERALLCICDGHCSQDRALLHGSVCMHSLQDKFCCIWERAASTACKKGFVVRLWWALLAG